ncbi:MAG: hypothetical protein AAFY57_12440 [Cyanobacteria bacterium J06642_2]
MTQLKSLFLPAMLGLVAGVGHGIVTHYAGLPLSLVEQFVPPLQANPNLFE